MNEPNFGSGGEERCVLYTFMYWKTIYDISKKTLEIRGLCLMKGTSETLQNVPSAIIFGIKNPNMFYTFCFEFYATFFQ